MRFQKGNLASLRHGHASHISGKVSPEYGCWINIKARCLNPQHKNYSYYGGRGITVCARWRDSFEAFLADVGLRPSPKHTIDRYPDNNGHYEPGNVRWATRAQQIDNRRNMRTVVLNGETITVAEACRRLGLNLKTVQTRIKIWGWAPEEAITPLLGRRDRPRRLR
jgi:hypothetical protein